MRRIIGNHTVELSAAAFARLRERHHGLLLDVGTGDGKHALHAARC
jgi:16S rRNA (adenine(1408)-N(1))-methyltransferase